MSHLIPESNLRAHTNDKTFELAKKAKEAKLVYDDVIDSTIGTLLDDDNKLVALKSVFDVYRTLSDSDLAGYAAIEGESDYLEYVKKACFGDYQPEGYIQAIATPGGTGAIRHSLFNFLEEDDIVICPDLHWGAYENIAKEYKRQFITYPLFNEKGAFNIEGFRQAFESALKKKGRVLSIINSPANNPTGYSLTDTEWDEVISIVNKNAKNDDNAIILLNDIAYIDFAREGSRSFMTKFSGLKENVLTLFAYSQSKSMTMYGLRSGALIAVSSSKEVIEDVYYTCKFSNRANWSNGAKGAMKALVSIYSDEKRYNTYLEEIKLYRSMLRQRADSFLREAEKHGLKVSSYLDGYFVSILTDDPQKVSDRLIQKRLFVVPFNGKCIRFALCSVREADCVRAVGLIKEALEEK